MAIDCSPGALAVDAACFLPLAWRTRKAIRVMNLNTFVSGDPDPAVLAADAACFMSLSWRQRQAIRIMNYCTFLNL